VFTTIPPKSRFHHLGHLQILSLCSENSPIYSEGYVDYGLESISSPEADSFGISQVGGIVSPIGDRNLQFLECRSINS
jgi:hypothetical protein